MGVARRASSGLVGSIGVLAMAALLTSCAGSTVPATDATSQPAPPATTSVPTPSPTPFGGDVRTLLLTLPSAVTKTVSPQGSVDGKIDLDDAARYSNDPAEGRKTLQQYGFREGAQIEWKEKDKTWIGVFLLQLGDKARADLYSTQLQRSYEIGGLFGSCLPIAGVEHGCVYERKAISTNGRWLSEAVFARGDFSVEIFSTGPKKVGVQRLTDYAIAQFQRLP